MSLFTASYFHVLFLILIKFQSTHPLEAGFCPSGWIKWRQSCYIRLPHGMNWMDASKACDRPGSGLVVPNSQEEHNFIFKTVAEKKELWIDCTDSAKEGTWLCGGKPVKPGNMFWSPPYPSTNNQMNCARMTTSYGDWADDIPCDGQIGSSLPFAACEMIPITDVPIYHIFTGSDGRIPQQCLLHHDIKNLTGGGVLDCGRACLAEPRCSSFNLWQSNKTEKKCQLNDVTRLEASHNDFKATDNCYYFDL